MKTANAMVMLCDYLILMESIGYDEPDSNHHSAYLNALDLVELTLAQDFSIALKSEIGLRKVKIAAQRNDIEESGCCHSHDFCDANMTMLRAFEGMFGHEFDTQQEQQVAIWNAAWERAVKERFFL